MSEAAEATGRRAASQEPTRHGRVRIGISGWRYAGWRGDFYPSRLRQDDELSYASRYFDTIEINGTHYSLQRPEFFARWHDETPADFVFAVKASRFITHMKQLRDIEAPLANFFAQGVLRLGSKIGPFLWQFSPRFRGDVVYTYRGTYRLDEFDQAPLPNSFRANVTSHSVMLTGYADFPILDSGVTPFIGAGIGWASNTLDSLSWQPTSTANITPALRVAPGATADGFAWQLTVGVSFLLSNVLALDFSYKYFDGGDVRSGAGNIFANGVAIGTYSGAHGAFVSDEITASIRYHFGSL